MNCNWSEERFERLLDGDLPPHERVRLESHLADCATCRDVLAELRAVDALLLTPRQVELAGNFTFATMAEVRTLAPPQRRSVPIAPYLLSYLAAAWIVIGAVLVLVPAPTHAWLAALGDLGHAFAFGLAGVAGSLERFIVRDTRIAAPLWLALAAAVNVGLVVGLALLAAALRPRIVERLRS